MIISGLPTTRLQTIQYTLAVRIKNVFHVLNTLFYLTFDLLILKIMFLFFKNIVKILKFYGVPKGAKR